MSAAEEKALPQMAAFTVHTPSGSTNACVKHAKQLENLFGRMWGLRLATSAAPDGARCDNCANEAKTGAAQ